MAEQTTQQSEAPVETQTMPTPLDSQRHESSGQTGEQTLEDIAKKYSIEDQTKSFTAKPAPNNPMPSPAAPSFDPNIRIPDPVTNPDDWTRFYAQQNAQVSKTLGDIASTVTEMRKQQEQERLNTEVNKAVERVNSKLNVDPKYAEILLEKEYRDNPIFKRIWDNRYANPKALDEALDVIANNGSKVFQVKVDPQLAENQRAAKASQKAMATTQNRSQTDDLLSLSDHDFDREWNRLKGY